MSCHALTCLEMCCSVMKKIDSLFKLISKETIYSRKAIMDILIHEKQYRGERLIEKIAECSLMLCGAGAIGSNLMDNMVRQGFKKFMVIDNDRVEAHNSSNQIYGRRDVGQLKVAALKTAMFNSMGVTITDVSRKLETSNVDKYLKKGSLVVDGFDNPESRGLVHEHCKANKIDCLHIGLYMDTAEICWNEDYKVPTAVKGLDVCEYPLARNVVLMSIAVATEVLIRYLDIGAKENYTITMKDFKILPKT